MEIDDVLTKYQDGDVEQRLSLFLAYRDLRDEFSRIEQDSTIEHAPRKEHCSVSLMLRLIGL